MTDNNKYFLQIEEAIAFADDTQECNVYNWQEVLADKNVCAFGLGKFFEDTHERLFKMCDVKYLCDNNKEKIADYSIKEEYKKKGIKCINPEALKQIENIFVIAVVGNYEPIRRQVEEIGVKSIHISEMHFKEYLKGKSTKWITEALPKIRETLDILADEKSKEVFTSVFCNKINRSTARIKYPELYSEGEYFTTGIFDLSEEEYLVDAGAYNGDTIFDFIEVAKSKFGHIRSFEISSENYKLLNQNITSLEASLKEKIDIYNKGVWIKEDVLWCAYDGDSDGCGIVKEEKGEKCQLVKLDDFLMNQKVTIIKMDIEGAEIPALEGSQNIIRNQNPKLAICVYHRPEDLWEIPLKIKEINNSYQIYLRHHSSQNYTDTVCYAHI